MKQTVTAKPQIGTGKPVMNNITIEKPRIMIPIKRLVTINQCFYNISPNIFYLFIPDDHPKPVVVAARRIKDYPDPKFGNQTGNFFPYIFSVFDS